jgi:hypothetical protein
MLVMSQTSLSNNVPPQFTWFCNPIPQPNGNVALQFIDGSGRYISVDIHGDITGSAAIGESELCKINGNLATFFPSPRFSGPNAICQQFLISEVPA